MSFLGGKHGQIMCVPAIFPPFYLSYLLKLLIDKCVCGCHLPGDQHSHVMMSWVCVTLGIEVFLPSTETGQSGVCMVNDLQPFLQQTAERETSFCTFLASFGFFGEQLETIFDPEEKCFVFFRKEFRVQLQRFK